MRAPLFFFSSILLFFIDLPPSLATCRPRSGWRPRSSVISSSEKRVFEQIVSLSPDCLSSYPFLSRRSQSRQSFLDTFPLSFFVLLHRAMSLSYPPFFLSLYLSNNSLAHRFSPPKQQSFLVRIATTHQIVLRSSHLIGLPVLVMRVVSRASGGFRLWVVYFTYFCFPPPQPLLIPPC